MRPALLKALVVIEWVLLIFLALVALIFAMDLPTAWNAQNCFDRPITRNCYPWGGEGPVADAGWHYANKRNYLAWGIFVLVILVPALAAAFWQRPGRRIFIVIGAIALLYAGAKVLPLIL